MGTTTARATMRSVSLRIVLWAALINLLAVGTASSQFLKVDDFESYAIGEINGQTSGNGTWVADSSFEVALEPGTSNKVLNMPSDPDNMNASNDYSNLELDEGTIGTLFFRFQRGGEGNHIIFGLSPVDDPVDFGAFEASISARTDAEPGRLQARSGGTYVTIQDFFELDEWINVWMVIDNDFDEFQVYAQSEITFPDQQLLDAGGNNIFSFRNGTFDPLTTFFVRTGLRHEGPFYFDDIYWDPDGENLEFPEVPEVPEGPLFVRGDANADGSYNISDGTFILNALFTGGPSVTCADSADANSDGEVNLADGVYVLNSLFGGGAAPAPPHPDCGTAETLLIGCDSFAACR